MDTPTPSQEQSQSVAPGLNLTREDLITAFRDGVTAFLSTREVLGQGVAGAVNEAISQGIAQAMARVDLTALLEDAFNADAFSDAASGKTLTTAMQGALETWLNAHPEEVLDAISRVQPTFRGQAAKAAKRRIAEAPESSPGPVADDEEEIGQ